jgi:hypothetical protein
MPVVLDYDENEDMQTVPIQVDYDDDEMDEVQVDEGAE